ncbi:hypothetical protein SAMN02745196_02195 [Clostridium collagenovorans DSM 3089]|uniref:Uncharacterized protein n=1 Tax=Clostridium collagenovorans DSM 3089 TaxID=1121306 RepID=A0A1M5XF62_9CLOT|nr:hypothetical protein [Clostridium collagenovorans]SHH98389.1 hypothetical protein SAMN02745196_02195 [Clostridium collagenovorans DSM 3089]
MRFKERLLEIILTIYVITAMLVVLWHFAFPEKGILQVVIFQRVTLGLQIFIVGIFLTLIHQWYKLQKIKAEIQKCKYKRNLQTRRGEGMK